MIRKGRPAKIKRSAIGERIVRAREARGLTQNQLANKLQVKQQTVAFWEREAKSPKSEYLPCIAEALEISIAYLLTGNISSKKLKPGPEGKLDKCFSQVRVLPKNQQDKIIEVINALLLQQSQLKS